jgi:hypothetical protein
VLKKAGIAVAVATVTLALAPFAFANDEDQTNTQFSWQGEGKANGHNYESGVNAAPVCNENLDGSLGEGHEIEHLTQGGGECTGTETQHDQVETQHQWEH